MYDPPPSLLHIDETGAPSDERDARRKAGRHEATERQTSERAREVEDGDDDRTVEEFTTQEYKYGFVTAIDADQVPPGLERRTWSA